MTSYSYGDLFLRIINKSFIIYTLRSPVTAVLNAYFYYSIHTYYIRWGRLGCWVLKELYFYLNLSNNASNEGLLNFQFQGMLHLEINKIHIRCQMLNVDLSFSWRSRRLFVERSLRPIESKITHWRAKCVFWEETTNL